MSDYIDDEEDEKDADLVIVDDPEPDPDDEEEEKEEKVPAGVQKRLDTMTFNMREAERREAAANSRAEASEKRLDAMEDATVKSSHTSFREEYARTRAQLTQAVEDGDTEKQVSAYEKMADMRAKAQNMAAAAGDDAAPAQPAPGAPQMTQEAQKWWSSAPWFQTAGFERETAMARTIDVQLTGEGMDQNDPTYFEALDSRLQRFYPDLYSGEQKEPSAKPRGPKNSSAPVNREAKGGKNKGRYVLTKQQLATAAEIGLTSEEELKEYAKECAAQGRGA